MKLSEQALATNNGGRKKPAAKRSRRKTGEPLSCPSCGALVDATPDDGGPHARNTAHHRKFFAEVAAVTDNWKNTEIFDPAGDYNAMRGWLLTEAGHCDIADVRLSVEDARNPDRLTEFMSAAMAAIVQSKLYGRIAERSGFFCVLIARSIAYQNCGEVEFRRIHARVQDVLEREGFDIEALEREARAASVRRKERCGE